MTGPADTGAGSLPGSRTSAPPPAHDDGRQLSSQVLTSVYRLVKGCLLHDDANQSVAQLVDLVASTLGEFFAKSKAEAVTLLFLGTTVFVNRQTLRASRETYQLAFELGELLAKCGATELSLSRGVGRAEIGEMGRILAAVQRDPSHAARLLEGHVRGVRARKVTGFGGQERDASPTAKAARTFAASVMIVRNLHADLRRGKFDLPQGIKRVAQKLVATTESDGRLLVSLAAAPSDADPAVAAVSTAILALAVARQLTPDRAALGALAAAALLGDAGRLRLLGSPQGTMVERSLDQGETARLPASSSVALTLLGKLHPPSLARTVLAYEALTLTPSAAPAYGGRRTPTVLARALRVARAFVDLRTPLRGAPGASLDDAFEMLAGQTVDATEKTFVKLLLGALGLFPAGTLVELNTGEMGVVLSTPALPVDFARPPVRILYDSAANLLAEPVDLDLATPLKGQPRRWVRRPIDADETQLKQMRAYVSGLVAARNKMLAKSTVRPPSVAAMPAQSAPAPRPAVLPGPRAPSQPPAAAPASASPGSVDLGVDLGDLEPASSPRRLGMPPAVPKHKKTVSTLPPAQAAPTDAIEIDLVEVTSDPADAITTAPPPGGPPITLIPIEESASEAPASGRRRPRPAVARRDSRSDEDDPAILIHDVVYTPSSRGRPSVPVLEIPDEPAPGAPPSRPRTAPRFADEPAAGAPPRPRTAPRFPDEPAPSAPPSRPRTAPRFADEPAPGAPPSRPRTAPRFTDEPPFTGTPSPKPVQLAAAVAAAKEPIIIDAPPGARRPGDSPATLQVSWEQYGRILAGAERPPKVDVVVAAPSPPAAPPPPVDVAPTPPAPEPPPLSDTDALLAAYLAEEANTDAPQAPATPRPTPISAGLRWDEMKPKSSSGGLRWNELGKGEDEGKGPKNG